MILFFDLDGTLSDPHDGVVNCMRLALEQLGIAIESDHDIAQHIGPPLRDTLRSLGVAQDQVETAVGIYRERYARIGWAENRLYPGIAESLQSLRAEIEFCYVVTTKPTVFARQILEHFALAHHFRVIYGSELDGTRSDKTELLAHLFAQEAPDLSGAIMIGDRKFDMIGARNHGIRGLGVLWGYGSAQELRESGAERLCASPRELAATLREMGR